MSLNPAVYGATIADRYDRLFEHLRPRPEAIAWLVDLAGGGRILDVGCGTGRLALPLARCGLSVTALDVSPDMLRVLSNSAGTVPVEIVCADATKANLRGPFELALCMFNTLFMLGPHEQQRQFIKSVAEAMSASGNLLVEAFVPDMSRFGSDGTSFRIKEVGQESASIQIGQCFESERRILSQDISFATSGVTLVPCEMFYSSLAEIDDLMRPWFEVSERRATLGGPPFDGSTSQAVSVYRRTL